MNKSYILSLIVAVLCLAMLPNDGMAQSKYLVSISDATVTEGSAPPALTTATLTISLDRAITQQGVVIRVIPYLQTATGPTAATLILDVLPVVSPAVVTFRLGDISKTVQVQVVAGYRVESDERIFVKINLGPLSDLVAEIVDDTGELRILNDDQADVSVEKSIVDMYDNPVEDVLSACQEYKYVGCFRNDGPGNLYGEPILVVDQLSPLVEFLEASPGGVYNSGDHTVTWTLNFTFANQFIPGFKQCGWIHFKTKDNIIQGSIIVNKVCIELPEFTYFEGHDFQPDPNMDNNCFEHQIKVYTADVDFCSQFDSDRNVGPAPVVPNFWSLKELLTYEWNLGDKSKEYTPDFCHAYWTPTPSFDETAYDVALNGNKNKEFIQVYEPDESSYTWLKLVSASPSNEKAGWENAIDGDTYLENGTAFVSADATGHPWAIFEFTDQGVKLVDKIRMMNDTGITPDPHVGPDCKLIYSAPIFNGDQARRKGPDLDDGTERHVTKFSVYVSTTGTEDADFELILQAEKTNNRFTPCEFNDDWMEWEVAPESAKYVKLVINEPATFWRQLGEFEVYEQKTLPSVELSLVEALGNPAPNGTDFAEILLALNDKDGNPLNGRTFHDIRLFSIQKFGKENFENECLNTDIISEALETATPGIYRATMTSTKAGTKIIKASVNGVVLNGAEVLFGQEQLAEGGQRPAGAADNALVFVTGTPAYDGQGWDNAVDGDVLGWDGTTTARGSLDARGPAWAIFEFADKAMYKFNIIVTRTDNGTDDDAWSNRQATVIEVLASTTGMNASDFQTVTTLRRNTGEEKWTKLGSYITAKYLKVILHQPTWNQGGWRQLVELGLQTEEKTGAVPASRSLAVAALPTEFALEQNYPNPFNPVTSIRFNVPEDSYVTLKVFNSAGHEVTTLVDGRQSAGYHQVEWNAADSPSGIYFYQMIAGSVKQVKRMILIK